MGTMHPGLWRRWLYRWGMGTLQPAGARLEGMPVPFSDNADDGDGDASGWLEVLGVALVAFWAVALLLTGGGGCV